MVHLLLAVIYLSFISLGLQSDRLTKRLGAGRVTAASVGLTAAALFGFSASGSFWGLCLWAIPYGLGAGSVDAALNNYVALHYASRHMSWLHCMWGLGAAIGPYIMGLALSGSAGWQMGYRYISLLQIVLTAVLAATLPLWRVHQRAGGGAEQDARPLTLSQILRIPWSRPPFCGAAATCTSTGASRRRRRRAMPGCSSWASPQAGRSAAFSP